MKSLVWACLAGLFVGCAVATTAPVTQSRPAMQEGAFPQLRTGLRPSGVFGPLGEYLTVEGVRAEGAFTGEHTLRIDTVNGQKLNEPIAIWVNNLLLPPKQRCVLKGYETGQMIGTSPAEVEAAIEQKKPAGVSQACWQ